MQQLIQHPRPSPSCSFTTQAPVPGATIVMTLVAYSTAFGSTGAEQPAGLAYIIAISWLTERFETITNVTGDLTVTAIVANKVNVLVDEAEKDIEGAENVGSVKRSSAAGTEEEE